MNSRHAGALALVAWYLVIPPITENGRPYRWSGPIRGDSVYAIDLNAPLSKWGIEQTYDSAKRCNDYRESTSESWKKEHWPQGSRRWAINLSFTDSQCIASDDPRLRK